MDDGIKKIVEEINTFVFNNSSRTDPVNLHFDILDAVFENLSRFCSEDTVKRWSQTEDELLLLGFVTGRQNSFLRLFLEHLETVDNSLKAEIFYDSIKEVSSKLVKLTDEVTNRFPKDTVKNLELLKKQKEEFDRLVKLEEEVRTIDGNKLSEELKKLKTENEEKAGLLEQKELLIKEMAALDKNISAIDSRKMDTDAYISKLNSLIEEIHNTSLARDEFYKLRFSELEEEKDKLAKIEKDINSINSILSNGRIGVEITEFYPNDFNRSEIGKLESGIALFMEKIRALIEKKEKIANDLKGGTNAK